MTIENILTSLGLNKKQIYVFMALMELGSQPVSVLAKKTSLNRTTIYSILTELIKSGFAGMFVKSNIKYFRAISSDDLIDMAKRKKDEFSAYESELKVVLPKLQSRFNPYLPKADVSFFEGIQGVKNVLEDISHTKDEILAYRSVESWIKGQAFDIVRNFDDKMIFGRSKIKMIIADSPIARDYFADLKNKRFVRQKFENEIYLYENKVASISFISGSMFGVIIKSNENSKTQKAVFYLGWK